VSLDPKAKLYDELYTEADAKKYKAKVAKLLREKQARDRKAQEKIAAKRRKDQQKIRDEIRKKIQ